MKSQLQRIQYLHLLRGLACILVVFGHIFFIGINGVASITPYVPRITQNIFGATSASRNVLTSPAIFLGVHLGINFGFLGVSIFFLISGYVICKSLESESWKQFLIRRVFRIYPIVLTGVFFTGAVTALYLIPTHIKSPDSVSSLLSSSFILNGFIHKFDAVPVLWSLEIEIFFYVFMTILRVSKMTNVQGLLYFSGICVIFTYVANLSHLHRLLGSTTSQVLVHLSFTSLHLPYLIIGAIIYRVSIDAEMHHAASALGIAILSFLIGYFIYQDLHGNSGGVDIANGAWALAIFSYFRFAKFPKGLTWILSGLADISFPLYVIHIPFAWIVMNILADQGIGMLAASVLALILCTMVAWIMHQIVEKPVNAFGKKTSLYFSS
jgi:peptidoglycan/LPS O-acetylase OafA/YrhL